MKGTDVFDSLNNLPADMITAAELPPDELAAAGYGVTKKQKRREQWALVTSSGWFAAAVSLIVALTAVVFIIRAGRNAGAAGPKTVGTTPGVVNPVISNPTGSNPMQNDTGIIKESDWLECNDFAFKYKILNEGDVIRPGDTVSIACYVKNLGPDFTYTGGSGDFCPSNVVLICSEPGANVTYDLMYALREDMGTFTVQTGDVGSNTYYMTLPADCPCGFYQLSMQYGNGSVGWSGCITVSRDLTFSYSFTDGRSAFFRAEDVQLTVTTEVSGAPFRLNTADGTLYPKAWIVHHTWRNVIDVQWETQGKPVGTEILPGRYTAVGRLDLDREDAPAGVYDLVITLEGCTYIKEGALTLTDAREMTTGEFTFGWSADKTIVERGGQTMLTVSLVNNGPPIMIKGSSGAFHPDIVLRRDYHMIVVPVIETADYREYTIPTGGKVEITVPVSIPSDAPLGSYALELSYGNNDLAVFDNAVQVVRDEDAVQGGTTPEDIDGPREPGWDDEFQNPTPGLRYELTSGDRWSNEVTLVSAAAEGDPAELRLAGYVEAFKDYLTVISADAFHDNSRLTTLYIPKGVWVIEPGAFASTSLTTICYQGYLRDWETITDENSGWNDGLGVVTVICRDSTFTVWPPEGPGDFVPIDDTDSTTEVPDGRS